MCHKPKEKETSSLYKDDLTEDEFQVGHDGLVCLFSVATQVDYQFQKLKPE